MSHKITYGNRTFEDRDILSGECHLANDLMSASLEMNTFDFEVESGDTSLLAFTRNAPLTYYNDGQQVGIFFVQKVKRTAKNRYSFTCTSAMGLLDETDHYGGIYTGQTVKEVVADICGSVPHWVKTNLADIALYGYLPKATRRENLSQVLFAIGATVKSDRNGYLRIEGLWDGVSDEISENRAYADGAVESDTPITRVVVTEHQYIRGMESKKLYEGTTAEGDIITFDEPVHDLVASGFRVMESGPNYAKLSSGNGTLTGTPYIHSTREVSKVVNTAPTENVVRVEDATLVSLANANAVAERLARYYACREVVEQDIVYEGEQPGNVARVAHPYGGMVQSCIESMDITLSSVLRSAERHRVGFVPMGIGQAQYYDAAEVIASNMDWRVPDGVTNITAVLIGGGEGGASGCKGENGEDNGGNPGKGGVHGEGGSGGKVLQVSQNVVSGNVFHVMVGQGGQGGQYADSGSQAGGQGTDTLFGAYSSSSGASSPNGFTDILTGNAYGTAGPVGTDGGDGGAGGNTAESFIWGNPGESVGEYTGGQGGSGDGNASGTVRGAGGGGGGAAIGGNGTDGGNAKYRYDGIISGGDGGNGGNATASTHAPTYGQGGIGGNGGGGGGAAGRGVGSHVWWSYGGAGGTGSSGGHGGNGCVIVYYRVFAPMSSGAAIEREGRERFDKYGRRIVV